MPAWFAPYSKVLTAPACVCSCEIPWRLRNKRLVHVDVISVWLHLIFRCRRMISAFGSTATLLVFSARRVLALLWFQTGKLWRSPSWLSHSLLCNIVCNSATRDKDFSKWSLNACFCTWIRNSKITNLARPYLSYFIRTEVTSVCKQVSN